MLLTFFLQSVIFLSSEMKIRFFLGIVEHNRAVALAVRSLHVVLCEQLKQVTLLRECRKHLRYLEDLELVLPRLMPSRWGRLLRDLHFHHLDLLRANAPHTVIAAFLEDHVNVAFLSIEDCGRTSKPCPLDGNGLPVLCDVSGPFGCVSALVQNNPVSRVTAHQSPATQPIPAFILFSSLSTSTACLTVLELELSPMDFDVLECLTVSTPALIALKLMEVQAPTLVSFHWIFSIAFDNIK